MWNKSENIYRNSRLPLKWRLLYLTLVYDFDPNLIIQCNILSQNAPLNLKMMNFWSFDNIRCYRRYERNGFSWMCLNELFRHIYMGDHGPCTMPTDSQHLQFCRMLKGVFSYRDLNKNPWLTQRNAYVISKYLYCVFVLWSNKSRL